MQMRDFEAFDPPERFCSNKLIFTFGAPNSHSTLVAELPPPGDGLCDGDGLGEVGQGSTASKSGG